MKPMMQVERFVIKANKSKGYILFLTSLLPLIFALMLFFLFIQALGFSNQSNKIIVGSGSVVGAFALIACAILVPRMVFREMQVMEIVNQNLIIRQGSLERIIPIESVYRVDTDYDLHHNPLNLILEDKEGEKLVQIPLSLYHKTEIEKFIEHIRTLAQK